MGIFSFLQGSAVQHEPRLMMVSDIPIKRWTSMGALRKTVYELSTPEWEKTFVECGFPPDDGRRKFFDHEAHDKLGFMSDRLFEQAGTAKRWVRNSTDVGKFFQHYSAYEDILTKLQRLEHFAAYYNPLPSEELSA